MDDKHLEGVLRDNGLEEGKDADEHFNALEAGQQTEFRTEARFRRHRVEIAEDTTKSIQAAVAASGADLLTKVHARLDKMDVPPNPGAGPAAGKKKDPPDPEGKKPDPLVVPEGYVKKDEMETRITDLTQQLQLKDVRQAVRGALEKAKAMPDAIDFLEESMMKEAVMSEDGRPVIRRKKLENGQEVIQDFSIAEVADGLRTDKKSLFSAEVVDGGGGGGAGDRGDKLPGNITLRDLQQDPALVARVIKEKGPEEIARIEKEWRDSPAGKKVAAAIGGGVTADVDLLEAGLPRRG